MLANVLRCQKVVPRNYHIIPIFVEVMSKRIYLDIFVHPTSKRLPIISSLPRHIWDAAFQDMSHAKISNSLVWKVLSPQVESDKMASRHNWPTSDEMVSRHDFQPPPRATCFYHIKWYHVQNGFQNQIRYLYECKIMGDNHNIQLQRWGWYRGIVSGTLMVSSCHFWQQGPNTKHVHGSRDAHSKPAED